MTREVVEGLKSTGCVGVVSNAIFTGAEEIFQGMDSGFVVLLAWIVAVRCKECEGGGDVRARASDEPINCSDDALVDLGSLLEIRVSVAWQGRELIGKPERYGVMFGTWFIFSTLNPAAVNSVNAD